MRGLHSCQSDEHGAEHREHHSLDEADQALEAHHEDAHQHRQGRHRELYGDSLRSHEEDDARDSHGYGVSCHHVGKESDHQGEGLREDAHELDERDDGCRALQPCGHIGPEDILPVVFVARELYDDKRAEGKEERHGDVARHVA